MRRCDELYLGGSRGSHNFGPLAYDVADQDAEQAARDDQQPRGLQGVGEAGGFEWFACHWDPLRIRRGDFGPWRGHALGRSPRLVGIVVTEE